MLGVFCHMFDCLRIILTTAKNQIKVLLRICLQIFVANMMIVVAFTYKLSKVDGLSFRSKPDLLHQKHKLVQTNTSNYRKKEQRIKERETEKVEKL